MKVKTQFFNVVLRGITLFTKLAFILAIASYLTLEEVGLFGLFFVTINMAVYFVGFEFYTYSNRDILARPINEWGELLTSQLVFFILLYMIVLPLSLLIFYFGFLPWWLAGWFVVLLVSEHFSLEVTRLLITLEKQIMASIILFLRQAAWAILFLIFIVYIPEARSIKVLLVFWVAGSVFSVFIGMLALSGLGLGVIKQVNWKWIKQGLPIALPIFISSIALKGIFTIDRYIFGAYNSIELLGVYSVYIGMASAILSFMEAGVFVFYFPKMTRAYKSGNTKKYLALFCKLKQQVLIWGSLLTAGALLIGPIVFWFIPNKVYFEYWPIFSLMVIAIFIYIVSSIYHYGLFTANNDIAIIKSNVSGFFVFCAISYAFADAFEVYTVSFAMVVSFVCIMLFKRGELEKWLQTNKI